MFNFPKSFRPKNLLPGSSLLHKLPFQPGLGVRFHTKGRVLLLSSRQLQKMSFCASAVLWTMGSLKLMATAHLLTLVQQNGNHPICHGHFVGGEIGGFVKGADRQVVVQVRGEALPDNILLVVAAPPGPVSAVGGGAVVRASAAVVRPGRSSSARQNSHGGTRVNNPSRTLRFLFLGGGGGRRRQSFCFSFSSCLTE